MMIVRETGEVLNIPSQREMKEEFWLTSPKLCNVQKSQLYEWHKYPFMTKWESQVNNICSIAERVLGWSTLEWSTELFTCRYWGQLTPVQGKS